MEVCSGGNGHATGGRGTRFAYRLPSRGGDGVNPSVYGGRADGDVTVIVEDAVKLPEKCPAALRALSRRMLSCDPATRPRLGAVVTALEASLANTGDVGSAQYANCAHMRMQVALLEDQVAAFQAMNARQVADNARFTAAANRGNVVTPCDVNAGVDSGTDGNNGYSSVDAEATDAAADAAASPEGAKATTELLDFIMDRWNQERTFTFKQLDKFLSKGADINAQTPVEPLDVRAGCVCALVCATHAHQHV